MSACRSGKEGFTNARMAHATLLRMVTKHPHGVSRGERKRGHATNGKAEVYRCEWCGLFHVGHGKPKVTP